MTHRWELKFSARPLFTGTGVEDLTGRKIGLGDRLCSGVTGLVRLKNSVTIESDKTRNSQIYQVNNDKPAIRIGIAN